MIKVRILDRWEFCDGETLLPEVGYMRKVRL
jgi:hypothetical protein